LVGETFDKGWMVEENEVVMSPPQNKGKVGCLPGREGEKFTLFRYY